MKYSFRRGLVTGDEKIEVTSSAVKYFKGKGAAKREISFADVKAIQGFSNMSADNEKGERFALHMVKLVPKMGRSIVFGSSSFIRNAGRHRQVAKDQSAQYIKILLKIKERVAEANPDAILVDGNLLASILAYACSLIGICVIAVTVFGSLFWRTPIGEEWLFLLGLGLFSLMFVCWGYWMGTTYWPKKRPLAESIYPANETASDT